MDNILTVGGLRDLLAAIPDERNNEPIAVFCMSTGERFNAVHLDDLCGGVVDINFDSFQYDNNNIKG